MYAVNIINKIGRLDIFLPKKNLPEGLLVQIAINVIQDIPTFCADEDLIPWNIQLFAGII